MKSPAELTKEKKCIFFLSIKTDWAKIKLAKKKAEETILKNEFVSTITPIQSPQDKIPDSSKKIQESIKSISPLSFAKQIIKSKPNKEQTDDLEILYSPNSHFEQDKNYLYPVVKMPKEKSSLKLPRLGRSNQKGYKENDFFNES